MNQYERGIAMPLVIAIIAGVAVVGGAFFIISGGDKGDADTSQELVGNSDLDESNLPDNVRAGLEDINRVVDVTDDCSAGGVSAPVPNGWQCRKVSTDFTLYTSDNTVNVTIGTSQGMSSCDLIPGCTNEPVNLSGNFADMKKMVNPSIGTTEIVGTYSGNTSVKVLVTSNDTLTESELADIKTILDSVTVN